jgi:hypothetical protein
VIILLREGEKITEMDETILFANDDIIEEEENQESFEDFDDIPGFSGVGWSFLKEFQPKTIPAWHSSSHDKIRENVRQNVLYLILQSSEWSENLHEVSCILEHRLYFMAASLEEYFDPLTLVKK